MSWTEKDLNNLKSKGLKVIQSCYRYTDSTKPKIKIVKRSIEKIPFMHDMLKLTNKIDDYVTELQFDEVRKFCLIGQFLV
jgi:hypothetical protein